MSLEFLLTSLLVVASPGTGVVYTIAAGLAQGWRASLVAAFGCTLGCAPHALAAVSGLAALLYASPLALQALSYGGALYLLWMAWGMLREQGPLQLQAHQGARSNATLIRSTCSTPSCRSSSWRSCRSSSSLARRMPCSTC